MASPIYLCELSNCMIAGGVLVPTVAGTRAMVRLWRGVS